VGERVAGAEAEHADVGQRHLAAARLGSDVAQALDERAVAAPEQDGVVVALDYALGDLPAVVEAARDVEIMWRHQVRQAVDHLLTSPGGIPVHHYGEGLAGPCLQKHSAILRKLPPAGCTSRTNWSRECF